MDPINQNSDVRLIPDRVGLMAGWGRYPIVIAEALKRQGRETFCLGAVGHADPRLADICHDFRWFGLGRLGSVVRYFKRHGVTEATMAGKLHKQFMFQPWFMIRCVPDLLTMRSFAPHFLTRKRNCKDDSLMNTAVNLFASGGIQFAPATDYAPELLVKKGRLTRRGPTSAQTDDIQFGWNLAKEMGRLDVGQSVAVKNQAVLAIEAVEGTDQCIRRAGDLCPVGGFTVVKTAKPRQDMRFDVPTVGLGTLQSMVAAGARVLAIEADRTILIDQEEFLNFANRNKLIIVALEKSSLRQADAA